MSFWNKIENRHSDAPGAPSPAEPLPPAAAAPPPPPAAVREPAREPVPAPPVAAPPPPPAAPATPDLRLGRGVRLEGKLKFSGAVRIDATFQGSIATDGVLVVGSAAKVDAEIACGTVVIEGEVNGNVVASSAVELKPTARLRGDVETPSFSIERGAVFEGASRRPGGTASSDRRAGKHAAAPESGH